MLYNDIYSFTPTGKIENDIKAFLLKYNKEFTYKHSIRVANEARKIAEIFYEDEEKAAIAGCFHDSSAIFPNEERIAVAEKFGIEILQEEREFPMIIHQKLSRVIAKEIFKIEDEEVLNAISYHTTLRKHAAFVYISYLWERKDTLKVIHPWLEEAYWHLKEIVE